MQIDIRLDPKLEHPILRRDIETRVRSTMTRLKHRLASLSVSVSARTLREGGETTCRVSGVFARGGTLHVRGHDASARVALDSALQRFRYTVRRRSARQRSAGDRSTIRVAPMPPAQPGMSP